MPMTPILDRLPLKWHTEGNRIIFQSSAPGIDPAVELEDETKKLAKDIVMEDEDY